MRRLVPALLFLLTLGFAFGQPVDYQIACTDTEPATVVGVFIVVEGEVLTAFEEGWTCESTLVVWDGDGEPVEGLSVTAEVADDVLVVTLSDDDVTVAEGQALELPAVAIAGMAGAQENRARAQDRADEARAKAEDAGPPADLPVPPEAGEEPEDLPEPPETPDLPDQAPETPGRP